MLPFFIPIKTNPTGFCLVPPLGPAIPVIETFILDLEIFDKFPKVTEWCDRIRERDAYSMMRPTKEQRFTSGLLH